MNHNAKIKTFEKNRLDKQNQGASVERFYEYFVPKGLRADVVGSMLLCNPRMTALFGDCPLRDRER